MDLRRALDSKIQTYDILARKSGSKNDHKQKEFVNAGCKKNHSLSKSAENHSHDEYWSPAIRVGVWG